LNLWVLLTILNEAVPNRKENKVMPDVVLDVQTLPEIIFFSFSAEKVKYREENGSIILTPIIDKKNGFDDLFGMFSDGRISTEEYMKEKQMEKELED
jgi:virulence-associated protein VagC